MCWRCLEVWCWCCIQHIQHAFSMYLCGVDWWAPQATPLRIKDSRLLLPSCSACHSPVSLRKYSLTNQKWFFLFFMCNLGAYSGARWLVAEACAVLRDTETFHRTLFLPPLADACQSVRGLIKFQVKSNFALFDVRIACHESPFLLKRDRGKTLGACVISHSLSTSECWALLNAESKSTSWSGAGTLFQKAYELCTTAQMPRRKCKELGNMKNIEKMEFSVLYGCSVVHCFGRFDLRSTCTQWMMIKVGCTCTSVDSKFVQFRYLLVFGICLDADRCRCPRLNKLGLHFLFLDGQSIACWYWGARACLRVLPQTMSCIFWMQGWYVTYNLIVQARCTKNLKLTTQQTHVMKMEEAFWRVMHSYIKAILHMSFLSYFYFHWNYWSTFFVCSNNYNHDHVLCGSNCFVYWMLAGCSRSGLRKSSYRLVMCFATISSAIQSDQFQALERKTYADIINCSPILLD